MNVFTTNTIICELMAGRGVRCDRVRAQHVFAPRSRVIGAAGHSAAPHVLHLLGREDLFMVRAMCKESSSSWRRAEKPAAVSRRAVDHTLEQLESRRLYSVTATSAGGVV